MARVRGWSSRTRVLLGLIVVAATVAGASPPAGAATIGASAVVVGGIVGDSIAVGPDGNLWYTNTHARTIGRMTPAGERTTFAGPGIVAPSVITAGPDGNVWFTNGRGSIGRITPSGAVTTFGTVATIDIPFGIVAGPDGNLWFTTASLNKIGRITPAGVITTFTDAGLSTPTAITRGSDNNLWFVNSGPSKAVGRITTAGVITVFPNAGISPYGSITSGPDGALWFASSGKIGRSTTAGAITTFPANINAEDEIVAGPDGNLWYTSGPAHSIQAIDTTGAFVSAHTSPDADTFNAITATGGKLWWTATSPFPAGGSVGSLTTGGTFDVHRAGLSNPSRLAKAADATMWALDGDALRHITTQGEITTHTGTDIAGPSDIVRGPDNAMWFTNQTGGSIGRITFAGQTASFTTTGLVAPSSITTGPDGNLWFTYTGGIGRVTPTGTVTLFPHPGTLSGIAAGADGNLWFFADDEIGRVTPTGSYFGHFALHQGGQPVIAPFGKLVAAPDGNLWFVEQANDTAGITAGIVRITPAGALTAFHPSELSQFPVDLTLGPDGNLWALQDASQATVVRVTTAGQATSFPVPGQEVRGIAAGHAGTVWYLAESLVGRVTAVTTPGAPTGVVAQPGAFTATVSWTAPTSDGGTPITGYKVTASPGGKTCVWAPGPLSCVVTGLTNGLSYTFTVQAMTTFGTSASSTPSTAVVPHFGDVPPGAPFVDDINWMANEGITTGFGDGTFRPASPVSRQSMAAFLYRYAGQPLGATPPCTPSFDDVPQGAPFCGEITWMVGAGITTGFPDGGFHPTAPVSRQAMSAFLYRFAGSPNGDDPSCAEAPFADVPAAATFCGEIAWMRDSNISTGYAGNLFKPADPVARQAMAAFLHRLLPLLPG